MGKRVSKSVKNEMGNKVVLKNGESIRKDGMLMFRYTDTQGKRRIVYSSTIDGLREKEERLTADKVQNVKSEAITKTINDVYGEWLELKRGIREHTRYNYNWLYNQYVKNGFGKRRIRNVNAADVRRFYSGLYDEQHLSVTSIDGLQTVMRQVFGFAVEARYIVQNPTVNAMTELKKLYNTGEQKHKALTVAQQKRFLDYVRDHPQYRHWYPLFAVMVGTGMRVGELTGLRWCDVDIKNGIVDVNHTLVFFKDDSFGKMVYKINPPKSKAGKRKIVMLDYVKEALIEEKKRQESENVVCRAVVNGYTNFIFVNRFGDTQHQGTLNKALCRIVRDANLEAMDTGDVLLPRFSCHNLRTTFCTRLAENNVSIKVAMQLMGHDDMETTMKVYTTVDNDWMQREMQNVNAFFKEANIGENGTDSKEPFK